ncbi:MAG: hypothetical protein ACFFAU_12035 [Candidatus Hodarchaeota archaeon]
MTRLIWGLLIFSAGVLDYVIAEIVFKTDSFGAVTIIPWGLAIISGLIIQVFSDRHITNIYSWEKPKNENINDTLFLILGFAIIAVSISFFNNSGFYFLSFPSITLISGFMAFVLDGKYFRKNREVLNPNLYLVTPIICVFAAILMIILIILDDSLFRLHSMLFGIAFGGSFSLIAFWNRNQINKYFENTDIYSNS